MSVLFLLIMFSLISVKNGFSLLINKPHPDPHISAHWNTVIVLHTFSTKSIRKKNTLRRHIRYSFDQNNIAEGNKIYGINYPLQSYTDK